MQPKKIEKEEIAGLRFPKVEVLDREEQRIERNRKLHLGARLGNGEKSKCRIVFNSHLGSTCVETTIWAVTDKYVCLKGGILILISSIVEVII